MSKKLGNIDDDDFTEESSSLTKPMLGKNRSASVSGGYPEDLLGNAASNAKIIKKSPVRINQSEESSDDGGSASDSGSDSNASISDTSSEGSMIGGNRKKL
jgi:hypothetical protein